MRVRVAPVSPRAPDVAQLLGQLTAELAGSGYTAEQTFGYSLDQLEGAAVHLVGAFADRVSAAGTTGGRGEQERDEQLVGVAGVELQPHHTAELKRFFVLPAHRGSGAAQAMLDALVDHARSGGVQWLRLETGDKQHAAMAFYRRSGFVPVQRFGPYVGSDTSVCMQRELTSG